MRRLLPILCLTLAVLLGGAGESFALPPCPKSTSAYWNNCFGTYTFASGDKYVGEYRNDKKHGQGTYTHADGDNYVGEYRDGKPYGQGTYTFGPSSKWAGDKYVGEFKDGKKHGQGTYTHANGNKYVGEYRNDKPYGQGTYTFTSGNKYVGEFRDGKRNGQGTYTHADGRVKEGIFENDKFQYAQKVTPAVIANKTPTPQVKKKPEQVDQRKSLELARRTQEALQVLGVYSGKVDGIIGVKTKSAIQGWQKRNGYPGTGEVTELQLAKLEQEAITHFAKKESEPKVAKTPEPKPSPPIKTGSSGSGFFVSTLGHVITNQHIVNDCGSVTVGDNANKQVPADVLETDRRNDLALLKISSMQMASAETKSLIRRLGIRIVPLSSNGLLRSEDVELGEDVLVAGYPYGDIFSSTIKVTKGIVSAVRGMGDDSGQFQMDAAVQPGNSGGPIYDENGNIVGVVISQLSKLKFAKAIGSLPELVNFGIKASTVRQFLSASGLPTKWSERSKRMSTKELAKIAKSQTVMVVCHP